MKPITECADRLWPGLCQVLWPHEELFWTVILCLVVLAAGAALYYGLRQPTEW